MKMKARGLLFIILFLVTTSIQAQMSEEVQNKIHPSLLELYNYKIKRTQNFLSPLVSNELALRHLIQNQNDAPDPTIDVIMDFEGSLKSLSILGATDICRAGEVVVARIPLSQLENLSNLSQTLRVSLPKPIYLRGDVPVTPMSDVSMDIIRANEARASFGYEGEDIVIGIIDTGIDFTHPSFRHPNGDTRVLSIWDQSLSGFSPAGFTFGREFTQNNLNANMNNNGFAHKDLVGHGTHVAGVAAGNGLTSNGATSAFMGVAPKADLIVVKTKTETSDGNAFRSTTADLIRAVEYIAGKAGDLGKPWVINISVGPLEGSRNGLSYFERALNSIVLDESLGDGRLIVSAAGNTGYNPIVNNDMFGNEFSKNFKNKIHAEGTGSRNFTFEVLSSTTFDKDRVGIEILKPIDKDGEISIVSPNGIRFGPITTSQLADFTVNGDGFINVANHLAFGRDRRNSIYGSREEITEVSLADWDDPFDNDETTDVHLSPGIWTIELNLPNGVNWDAYLYTYTEKNITQHPNGAFFTDDSYSNRKLIGEPGNGKQIITVGSINSKNDYLNGFGGGARTNTADWPLNQISYTSSPGPSRRNLNKPEIFAPGRFVAAARSKFVPFFESLAATDHNFWYLEGTSFASPHVAGAAALLLEKWIIDRQVNIYTPSDYRSFLFQNTGENKLLDVFACLQEDIITGPEDYLLFGGFHCQNSANPEIISIGNPYTYCVSYVDTPPLGDQGQAYYWYLNLLHDEGELEIAKEVLDGGNSSTFSVNLSSSSIPDGYNWARDENGNIKARVFVSTTDTDEYTHGESLYVGIRYKPNVPTIYKTERIGNTLRFHFFGSGSNSYNLYYDNDPRVPFDGTGAVQGASPINGISDSYFDISGLDLDNRSYVFAMTGSNYFGESGYSNEITHHPQNTPNKVGSSFDNPINVGTIHTGLDQRSMDNHSFFRYGDYYSGPNNQPSDDVFYKFNLTQEYTITFKACPRVNQKAYLHLLNSSGGHIQSDYNSNPTACESSNGAYISRVLQPGTYYLVVEGYQNDGGYTKIFINAEGRRLVQWTELYRTSTSTTRITNTQSTTGWKSSAISHNRIPSYRDGYFEFTIQNNSKHRMIGFSDNNYLDGTWRNHWNTIQYNMYLKNNGQIDIYESGSRKGSAGSYNAGDLIRIERIGGSIHYMVNGITRFTSSCPYTKSLIIDFCFYHPQDYFESVKSSEHAFDAPTIVSSTVYSEQNSKEILATAQPDLRDSTASFLFNSFAVNPNPAQNKLSLSLTSLFSENAEVVIYSDKTGEPVFRKKWKLLVGDNQKTIDISKLKYGTYIVEIVLYDKRKTLRILKI